MYNNLTMYKFLFIPLLLVSLWAKGQDSYTQEEIAEVQAQLDIAKDRLKERNENLETCMSENEHLIQQWPGSFCHRESHRVDMAQNYHDRVLQQYCKMCNCTM